MVASASTGASAPLVAVPRAQIAAQIQALGLPRNTLSALFDLPEGSPTAPARQNLGRQGEAALQLALPLLASPALVARTRAVFDEDRFLSTWIVTGSSNDPALTPYLLLAHDETRDQFQIKPVLNRETVARSFLPYLDTGLPVTAGDTFELPLGAFGLLVALCDLARRARFSADLDHAPLPQQFTARDIELALNDGRQHADPRWLLPHLLAIRPDLPAAADLVRWLPELHSRGWLAGGPDPVSLSESGLRLARVLDQRLVLLTFWVVGATPQGELASRAALFVRSPWHIWCFDAGGEDGYTASGASVDVAAAYGLLQDLLTPVGVPRPVEMPRPMPAAAPARPAKAGRKSPARPAPQPSPSRTSGGASSQPPAWQLVLRQGPQAGQVFPLGGPITLGRSADNTIPLEDDQASRRHARIDPQGGAWVLEDLGSRNGTFVNGQRIGQTVHLQAGDEVQMGNTLFQVTGPGQAEPAAARPICPHCGQLVGDGVRFCRYCGQPLP